MRDQWARAAFAIGLTVLLGAAMPAAAGAEPLVCSAAVAGRLSRQVGVACACRFFTESRLAGTPAGWRWDCGILRARLNHEVPVDLNPYPDILPDALYLEQTLVPEPHRPGPRRR